MSNKIRRKPIQLSKNSIAVIHIFNRYDLMDDLWMYDVDKLYKEGRDVEKEAAKEFINQLENEWNGVFLLELHNEIHKQLKNYCEITDKEIDECGQKNYENNS